VRVPWRRSEGDVSCKFAHAVDVAVDVYHSLAIVNLKLCAPHQILGRSHRPVELNREVTRRGCSRTGDRSVQGALVEDSDGAPRASPLPYQLRPRRRTPRCCPAHSTATSSSKCPARPARTHKADSGCSHHKTNAQKPIQHQNQRRQTVTSEQRCPARDASLDAPPKHQQRHSASSSAVPSRASPLPPPQPAIAAVGGGSPSWPQMKGKGFWSLPVNCMGGGTKTVRRSEPPHHRSLINRCALAIADESY
jgi:hypothetical protein